MISWWDWRKAIFGKIDQKYRLAFLREDKTQARVLIAIAAIWAFGFLYIEYLDLNLTPLFYYLAILRTLFISASFAIYRKLPRINSLDSVDTAILVWSIACVLLPFVSNLIRGHAATKNVSLNLAWVLGFYLLIPNRQAYKFVPAFLSSLISIYILFNYEIVNFRPITYSVLIANVSAAFALNVIGLLASLRLDAQRYQQYLIQKTMMDGHAQLKELANTDSLTGMLNRRSFFETADIHFDRFKRYHEIFSFVIVDLDNLKNINDTYGHPAGDHAIGLVTGTIYAEKRSSDTIGRLAGDEIGVLLPNTNANEAQEVLRRIKRVLAETIVESPSKQEFQVRFSAGITEAHETDETFDEIYRRADQALLSAKQSGRNRIENA